MVRQNPGHVAPANRGPQFLRALQSRVQEIGIVHAVGETLAQANISLSVEGDFDALVEHQHGMLFVGNHSDRWEFVGLMALLHKMGKADMRNVAKFYVKRQVTAALGHAAAANIIEVYPRILARDRRGPNLETVNRVLYRRHRLSLEDSAHVNERALNEAADFARAGGVLNIFPCGGVVDAATHPWREGVGRILTQIPDDERENLLVVPYRMRSFSAARMLSALAMEGRGRLGRPQTLNVQLAPIYTAAEIVNGLPDLLQSDPAAITARLRDNYVTHFETLGVELG